MCIKQLNNMVMYMYVHVVFSVEGSVATHEVIYYHKWCGLSLAVPRKLFYMYIYQNSHLSIM